MGGGLAAVFGLLWGVEVQLPRPPTLYALSSERSALPDWCQVTVAILFSSGQGVKLRFLPRYHLVFAGILPTGAMNLHKVEVSLRAPFGAFLATGLAGPCSRLSELRARRAASSAAGHAPIHSLDVRVSGVGHQPSKSQ
ncbi:hypothetical protein NDU88_003928 [Pleurodeles waltl]|uniref:Uncharacterized protein n=1 Tax=Pleurodeles waltl TaxID=8319 RepID=A0AAV7RFA7_PLEWA|nr:hypothetical protein NDU88_003928 [Pleurodeles waltl]